MRKLLAASLAVGIAVAGLAGIPTASAASRTLNYGTITDIKDWQASSGQESNFGPYYQAVYSTLLNAKSDGTVIPGLVTKWTYDKKQTTITLQLRKGVKFTNGEAFNATAVVKNLLAFQKGASPNASEAAGITSATATKPLVVTIKLDAPNPSFVAYMAHSMGFQQAPSTIGTPEAISTPVGCGPYVFDKASSVSGASYVFHANPTYWDAKNRKFDELVIKVLATPAAAVNAIRAGQVDLTPILDNTAVATLKSAGLTVASQQLNWVGLMLIDKGGRMGTPIKNVKVRQAINYAFDRNAALAIMGAGYGVTTQQVFASYNKGYVKALDSYYTFDQAKAKALLAEAGYPNGFSIDAALNGALPPAVAQFVKDTLAQIGITVNYTSFASGADFFAAVLSPKFPLFRQGLERNPNDWTLVQFMLARDAAWNPSGYGDSKTDALLAKIATSSGVQQVKYLQSLNSYIVKNAWFAPLYASDNYVASNNTVKVSIHAGNSAPYLSDVSPA